MLERAKELIKDLKEVHKANTNKDDIYLCITHGYFLNQLLDLLTFNKSKINKQTPGNNSLTIVEFKDAVNEPQKLNYVDVRLLGYNV